MAKHIKGIGLIAVVALLAVLAGAPAWAQDHEHGGGSPGGAPHGSPHVSGSHGGMPGGHAPFRPEAASGPRENNFHGRDIHDFGPHELETWRSGEWHHDWHHGRFGWWWWAGGFWYFYTDPIYPYPDYVSDVPVDAAPDPGITPPDADTAAPADNDEAPPQYWYYCDASKGYYPYVSACPSGWRQVPAKPPDAP